MSPCSINWNIWMMDIRISIRKHTHFLLLEGKKKLLFFSLSCFSMDCSIFNKHKSFKPHWWRLLHLWQFHNLWWSSKILHKKVYMTTRLWIHVFRNFGILHGHYENWHHNGINTYLFERLCSNLVEANALLGGDDCMDIPMKISKVNERWVQIKYTFDYMSRCKVWDLRIMVLTMTSTNRSRCS